MHGLKKLRRARPAALLTCSALLALAIAGAAYAGAGGSSATIQACASKHGGALRILGAHGHCRPSERAVRWNKTGPTGPAGPQGVTGPAGTVDTSNFYSKSQSDGRYLPLHGTADNAGQLGGVGPSGYVQNGFYGQETLRFISSDIAAGGNDQLYPALPAGRLNATCSDPATSATLQYVFEGTTGHVERVHGTSTTFGTSDTSLLTGVNDHVEYLIDYADGTVAKLDVFVANGPDGDNLCRFRVFATIVTGS
jgi:hypothetical protein